MSAADGVTVSVQPSERTAITVRAYLYGAKKVPWASIQVGDALNISDPADDFDDLLRLADAIRTAVAQARQLQQDADLADLTEVTA